MSVSSVLAALTRSKLATDETRWNEARSGARRSNGMYQRRRTPVGGEVFMCRVLPLSAFGRPAAIATIFLRANDEMTSIEPLGPAPRGLVPPRPTWQAFMQALCPVRELEPGDRPRDWTSPIDEPDPVEGADGVRPVDEASAPEPNAPESNALEQNAPARAPLSEPLGPAGARRAPQRYKVQFTATEEFVNLVERAKALLSHALPNAGLEEIQLRALRAYVAELEKQRYGAAGGRRRRAGAERSELADHGSRSGHRAGAEPSDSETIPPKPRRRGRHIPAAVRRAVFERGGGRCTYVDASGKRCRETRFLELHHVDAFAKGGEHDVDNLTLRCRAHNTLAAEEDFGRDFVEHARDTAAHESFAAQTAVR